VFVITRFVNVLLGSQPINSCAAQDIALSTVLNNIKQTVVHAIFSLIREVLKKHSVIFTICLSIKIFNSS